MSESNTYGSMFIAHQIELNVETLVLERLDMYMAEIQRQLGLSDDYFPHIAKGNIVSVSDIDDAKPGGHFPEITIVSPGTVGDPERFGNGLYRAKWGFGLVVRHEAPTQTHARQNSESYVAALRSLILQNKSLIGIAIDTKWKGEAYDETPVDTSRTVGVALLRFETTIDSVVDSLTIPNRDNDPVGHPDHHDDPGDYDAVETTGLTIDNTF